MTPWHMMTSRSEMQIVNRWWITFLSCFDPIYKKVEKKLNQHPYRCQQEPSDPFQVLRCEKRYHLLQWTRLMTKPILSLVVSSYRKWYRKMPFPAKIVNFKPHVRKDLISENFQLCKMLFLWKMVKQRELQLLLVTLRLKDFSVLLISNCQSPKGCCCCCCSVQ
jgi:hypothetical protein